MTVWTDWPKIVAPRHQVCCRIHASTRAGSGVSISMRRVLGAFTSGRAFSASGVPVTSSFDM